MAHAFEKCGNCGAPLESSGDGRAVSCSYCGAHEQVVVDPARLLSSLQVEAGSADALLQGLAVKLAEAFPDQTQIEWAGGLFSAKKVERFELATGDALFTLTRARHGVLAERADVVRGIALKTHQLTIDEWLAALSTSLAALADGNARAYASLRRFAQSG